MMDNTRPKIFAKSVWNRDQARLKLIAGCDGIEYQILNPDYDPLMKDDWWDDRLAANAVSIHMPLISYRDGMRKYEDDSGLETPAGIKYLPIVCERAEKIAEFRGIPIHVIIHIEEEVHKLKLLGLWDQTVLFMRDIADRYQNLIFSVENVIALLRQPLTHVDFVEEVNRPNVGTCLDTCHAMMTAERTRMLSQCGIKPVSFETFFYRNKDVCNWLHLNNAKNLGDGFGMEKGHGTPFDMEDEHDMKKLRNIIKFYHKYDYNCPFCIEIREDSYTETPVNYISTKMSLESILGMDECYDSATDF
jgi:hypothetical protein